MVGDRPMENTGDITTRQSISANVSLSCYVVFSLVFKVEVDLKKGEAAY